MSPRIYAYSKASMFAERNETAGHLLNVALLEAHDHSNEGHDRFIWAMERVVRYVKRVSNQVVT